MIYLNGLMLLVVYWVIVEGSSSESSKKEPPGEIPKGCSVGLTKYYGVANIQCRRTNQKHATAFLNRSDLMEGVILRMFCDEMKNNFSDNCNSDEGCGADTVCVKPSVFPGQFLVQKLSNVTADFYAFLKERNEPFNEIKDATNYYELQFGSQFREVEYTAFNSYYFIVKCEDCGSDCISNCEVKNCVIQDRGVDYHAHGHRPGHAIDPGDTYFISAGNYFHSV